jgi:hypothetical protein
MITKLLLANIIFYFYINLILSQTICYNPTTNCFDPTLTQSLLLQANQYTKCSRTTPIQQLTCIDSSNTANTDLCAKYSKYITSIKCSNSGTDDSGNVIWKCESNLPSQVGLGLTTVSCEGCTSSSDKLKISGSCGIFYQLFDKTNSISDTGSIIKSNSTHTMTGFEIFLCFLFGTTILICFIKICVGCSEPYLPTHNNYSRTRTRTNSRTNSRTRIPTQSYIPIISTEQVIIPETIPLTANYSQNNNLPNNNPSPINPNYEYTPTYQSISYIQNQTQTQTRPYIYPRTQVQVLGQTQSQPHSQVEMTDTSSFLSGYLTGKNLEEGNIGAAYFTSSLSNSNKGNNFSTGMALGMMEGSNHYNHHKSHKKHHNNSYQNNDLESSQIENISLEQNQTFANSTTR